MSFKCEILKDLKELKYIPEDVTVSRRCHSAYRKQTAERRTPYGTLLQQKVFQATSDPKPYPVQHPLAMLELAMASPPFAAYVRDALEVHGSPRMAFTCGNALVDRDNATGTVHGLYWSMYQLGPSALADESCWFERASFRTIEASGFVGGVSHLLDVDLG